MKAIEVLAEASLQWLSRQRLKPTPENYRLAFLYLDGQRAELSAAIDALTDGGVRLTQAQADNVYERFLGAAAAHGESSGAEQQQLRHQTLRLSDLAATAGAVTRDFGRELTAQLPLLATTDAGVLQQMFTGTIERADRAERELAATTAELDQLRQQFEAVRGDAERDALTGLPNRRGIDAYLAAIAAERPIAIAVCDIDHFKRVNDTYGHAVGDRVLKTVASALKDGCAPHFVGRWGGEEFVVIARGGEEQCASVIAEAKDDLGERHFKLRETDEPLGRITFSAGVTSLGEEEANTKAAFGRADALLYQAKRNGRNRVETHPPSA